MVVLWKQVDGVGVVWWLCRCEAGWCVDGVGVVWWLCRCEVGWWVWSAELCCGGEPVSRPASPACTSSRSQTPPPPLSLRPQPAPPGPHHSPQLTTAAPHHSRTTPTPPHINIYSLPAVILYLAVCDAFTPPPPRINCSVDNCHPH